MCENGDLQQYLRKKTWLEEKEAVFFLKQIMNGFHELYTHKYMHRDMKLANLMLTDNYKRIVIGDFGFAKKVEYQTKTQLGTPITQAPEILFKEDNQLYDSKADLWSIGVCFYQMLFGVLPFTNYNRSTIDNYNRCKSEMEAFSGDNLRFPDKKEVDKANELRFPGKIAVSESTKDLLRNLLQYYPELRPDWNQIFNDKLFQDSSLKLDCKENDKVDEAFYYISKIDKKQLNELTPDDYKSKVPSKTLDKSRKISEEEEPYAVTEDHSETKQP